MILTQILELQIFVFSGTEENWLGMPEWTLLCSFLWIPVIVTYAQDKR